MVGARAGQRAAQLRSTPRRRTWLAFTDAERAALAAHDHVALFEMGAHPFLTLTLWIAMFERDHTEPLAMQLDYAAKLAHVTLPYPDIST